MGKHSAPEKSRASVTDFMRAVVGMSPTTGRRSVERKAQRASSHVTTATGVMRSVRRKPMWAAVVVPVAAGAALVTTATMIGGNPREESRVVSEIPAPEQSNDPAAFEALPGISVDDKDQDMSVFASGLSKVGAKAAPTPEASDTDGQGSGQANDSTGVSGTSDLPVSGEPCGVSASIESGLSPHAIEAYRAVCANFPQVKSYGGRRSDPGSDHNSGNAVDAMIRGSVGDEITSYLIAHRNELNIKYVIWQQKIYAPYTGWKGRGMANRGSDTANHMDHVHISVN